MNVGSFIYDIFQRIVDLTREMSRFITSTVTIGNTEVSFLGVLGGVGAVALIIFSIAKS